MNNFVKKSLLAAVFAAQAAVPAFAQFPERPIAIVAGFSAGGAQDVAARIIANKLSEVLGQQVYVENKPGDSSNIGAVAVRDAAPDGYTLFIAGHTNSVNPALDPNVPVDILNDFKPVALLATVPNVLVVPAALPVTDVASLIELAKTTEGGLFYGSSGVGSVSHLSGEYLSNQAGIPLTHVPYKGSGDAMNDLIAGQLQLMFAARSAVASHIADGTLKPLAVTTGKRLTGLEDLPTVAEAGIAGFEASIWFGLVAPAETPDDVIAILDAAIDESLADPALQASLAEQGVEILPGDGPAFTAYMQEAMDRWATIIKENNIQAE